MYGELANHYRPNCIGNVANSLFGAYTPVRKTTQLEIWMSLMVINILTTGSGYTGFRLKATHNQCNVHTSAINIKTQMNIEGPSQGLILVCGRI